jgi:MFS-type transporter involved in bile tolerance (Atg22 family)
LCAILAIVFFAVFFAASRLHSKSLKLLLFWTPVTVISTLGLGLLALVVDAWLHVPKH